MKLRSFDDTSFTKVLVIDLILLPRLYRVGLLNFDENGSIQIKILFYIFVLFYTP